MSDRTERWMPGVPAAARWLGLAGLVPFFALALLAWLPDVSLKALAVRLLAGYGAIILSFMGGCRWGLAAAGLADGPSWRLLGASVVPALYAWGAAALPSPLALLMLGIGFLGLLLADLSLTRAGGAPLWWPTLRWPLSLGAAASLAAAAPAAASASSAAAAAAAAAAG